MIDNINNEYFKWLVFNVMGSNNHTYCKLCKDLYDTQFKWLIPNDINRSFDGEKLREKFCIYMDYNFSDLSMSEEANLLEVFYGLALRCEWNILDNYNNFDVRYWFNKFLINLELNLFTDNDYYFYGGKDKIDVILNRFMKRTYNKNGKGGLFPLRFCNENQRKVEIWYQMNSYLLENYYNE